MIPKDLITNMFLEEISMSSVISISLYVYVSIEKVNIFIGQCYSISFCLLESDWLVGWRLFLYGDWLFSLVVDFQLCSILVDAS